jgi:hypothetical protein
MKRPRLIRLAHKMRPYKYRLKGKSNSRDLADKRIGAR